MTGRSSAPPPRKVPLRTKLTYGIGSIAFGVKDNGFSTFLLVFYNQVIGMPAWQVSLALMIALVFDAFVDPFVGHMSDRTRTKWGRRHPYLYASALPVALFYLLLWNPPDIDGTLLFAYLLGTAFLVRASLSTYEVPSAALAPELTSDYHERTSVLSFRYLFGWFGGLGMMVIAFQYLLVPSAEQPNGMLNHDGYEMYALISSIVMFVVILITAFGTHGEIKNLPKPGPVLGSFKDHIKGIKTALSNKAFAILMLTMIFAFTSQGMTFSMTLYLYPHIWGFSSQLMVSFPIALLFSALIAFYLAPRLSKRFGKKETATVLSLVYLALGTLPYWLRYLRIFPENDSAMLVPILMVFIIAATASGICTFMIAQSMLADIVEDNEEKTGERAEGLFFSGYFFVQKSVTGVGIFLTGTIISIIGFPKQAVPGEVPMAVLDNLTLLFATGIVILSGLATFFIARFPFGQAEHEARLEKLSASK